MAERREKMEVDYPQYFIEDINDYVEDIARKCIKGLGQICERIEILPLVVWQ